MFTSPNGTSLLSRKNTARTYHHLILCRTLGYLACGIREHSIPFRKHNVLAELKNMFVLQEYRGKGIGTALYDAFLTWCKEHRVGRIRVVASAQNVAGIDFYRKKGLSDYDLALEADI